MPKGIKGFLKNNEFAIKKGEHLSPSTEFKKGFNKGIPKSEITKRKMSQAQIGNKNWLGKKHKPETIEKMRESRAKRNLPLIDTGIEKILQKALEDLKISFIKHKYIRLSDGTNHPADLFIEPNIVIEADGDYWHNQEKKKARDSFVNQDLKAKGYVIYRFWEHEITEGKRIKKSL